MDRGGLEPAQAGAAATGHVKVMHIITGLSRGGAETMLAKLVTQLDPVAFPAVVVSLTDEGTLGAELRLAGATLYTLGMRRGRPTLSAIVRLWRILRRERPQLIQSWLYHADLLATIVTLLVPAVPLVWNLRCSDMDLGQYSRQVRGVQRLLAWLSGRPSLVMVNSEAGRRHHERLGYRPRRWEIVANGFDTTLFRPDRVARDRWRDRLGVAVDQPLVGMVARVDPMKDHATFLAAATKVAAVRSDIAFVLIGRGTDTLPLPSAIQGRVRALGERDDVREILPALDLAVLSSAFGEGFPNAIGEAMACGVPTVVTDVGDAAVVVGSAGMVIPPRDAAALATAIRAWFARSPAERSVLGAAARRRIEDNYALPAIAARYAALYRAVAVPLVMSGRAR